MELVCNRGSSRFRQRRGHQRGREDTELHHQAQFKPFPSLPSLGSGASTESAQTREQQRSEPSERQTGF